MKKYIGIFYGSTTGRTQLVASKIANEFDLKNVDIHNVAKTDVCEVEEYSNIILGCSTWGMGDLQANFESFLRKLKKINLSSKRFALFGCGDQKHYPNTFVDSIGIIYEVLKCSDCKFVGKFPITGYNFQLSKAQIENEFIGLPIDEMNQNNLTTERIKSWSKQLKFEFLK